MEKKDDKAVFFLVLRNDFTEDRIRAEYCLSRPHVPQPAESRLGHFEARVFFVTGTEFWGELLLDLCLAHSRTG